MSEHQGLEIAGAVPRRAGSVSNWPRWAPYAAVAWSLGYAVLGLTWAVSGGGFPYITGPGADPFGPLAGRFGPVVAWIFVLTAGFPAFVVGMLMLRGIRRYRAILVAAGGLLTLVLLLLMTGLDLLIKVAYLPALLFGLLSGERSQAYLGGWVQWATLHQLLCLVGGFLWLASTVSYARQSSEACLVCGRNAELQGWTSPENAMRWGRTAVGVGMIEPVFYALTRIAWALGIPLWMNMEAFRAGQESGTWIGGLSLALFGLLGAGLMLGLVQHWGEVFPRWMIGLSGRRVPMALAIIPASLASVLLTVGGLGIWATVPMMAANMAALGSSRSEVWGALIFQLGPTLLLPVWGVALSVATLAYYFRRRGPCAICGRG